MCEICDLIKGRNAQANPATFGAIEALIQKISKLSPEPFQRPAPKPAPPPEPAKRNESDFELALHVVATLEADAIVARAKSSRAWANQDGRTDGFGKAVLLKTAELLTAAAEGIAS